MALTQVDVSQIAANAASFEALRSVVPTKEGQLAYLESHGEGTLIGGGLFRAALSAGTDDGGVIASSGGAYHWKRVFDGEVTPQMFGAIGDNKHDDSDALDAAMRSGYPVFMPPGTYSITKSVGDASATKGVSIRGSGDASVFMANAKAANLMLVGNQARVTEVWFRASVADVVAYITLGDKNAVIDTNSAAVDNCKFGDGNTTTYAISNIATYHLWYARINGCHFRGIGHTSKVVTAIRGYYSVNVTVSDCTFLYMGWCIRWEGTTSPGPLANHNEGWVIGNNTGAAMYGFFYSGNGLAPQFTNNIIDMIYGERGIECNSGSALINNNWIAAIGGGITDTLIYFTGDCTKIQGNRFVAQKSTVVIQGNGTPTHSSIQDNTIEGGGTGISFASEAPYITVSGNILYSQTAQPWDLSKCSFLTYFGNRFRNSAGAGSNGSLDAAGANIQRMKYDTSVVASLTANTSGQDFTVTHPAGLFTDTPVAQVSVGSGSTALVAFQVAESSNASRSVIRVMRPDGSSIPSGSFRFYCTFTDPNI